MTECTEFLVQEDVSGALADIIFEGFFTFALLFKTMIDVWHHSQVSERNNNLVTCLL